MPKEEKSKDEVVSSPDGKKWIIRQGSNFEGILQDSIGNAKREEFFFDIIYLKSSPYLSFIDIGAHVGSFAVRFAKYYKTVYAFEPDKFNHAGLVKNIDLNEIKNIEPVNIGLSDKTETLKMISQGGRARVMNTDTGMHSINFRPLDDLDIKDVRMMKVDVEGMEEKVLRGANKTILKYHPIILIETHERTYPENKDLRGSVDRIKKFFEIRGYSIREIAKNKLGDPYLVAFREALPELDKIAKNKYNV